MTRFTEEWLAQRLAQQRKAAAPIEQKPAKRPKYGNKKTVADGIVFDSGKEARRWQELRIAPGIGDLERQVRYDICINNVHVCSYVADFVYTTGDGKRVVEDVKSEATRKLPVFRLKKKLMKAVLGIEITEV